MREGVENRESRIKIKMHSSRSTIASLQLDRYCIMHSCFPLEVDSGKRRWIVVVASSQS